MGNATTTEEPYVRITLKDVYAEVRALREEIAPILPQVPDHEKRLRVAEHWVYGVPPTFILALLAAIRSWVK